MATLETVLQTIVTQRQIHAGHGAKNDIDSEGQTSTAFDDILAQSGAKDDVPEDEGNGEKSASKTLYPKHNAAFHQLKMQLSEKSSSKDLVIEPKTTDPKAIAVEDLTTADAATPDVEKELVDTKDAGPDIQKQKENRKIEVLSLAKVAAHIQKTEKDEKTPVDLTEKKTILAGEKNQAQSLPVEIKKTDEKPEKIVLFDKMEKPIKSLKHPADKKADDPKSSDKTSDEPQTSQGGAKSILDILGGAQINTMLNGASLSDTPKPKSGSTTENDVASVLEAVSQPSADQTTRHLDHVDDRKTDKPPQKEDRLPDMDRDTLFRFSKADSNEKPLEVRLGTSDKTTDGGSIAPVVQNKTENVVVLDARRYLALAPESNAFNLVSKIVGDKELSTAMTNSIIDPSKSAATSKVVNTLKLQMNPHDLGTVTATLRLRGEELSVAITVQNSAAYNHLTSDQDKMIDALRAQGFAVDQVTVQLVPSDRSSFQDQQGQPSSQGQQQQPRDGAAPQQGRQQGNGSPQDNSPSRTRQNNENLGNAGTGVLGSERTDGQVYI